ncbi:hypothetical protein HDV01_000828 [Terramyces sp. JEL0728]|nr:hypothetical protein HDV01_000820 [Terramyces sp. JEL0728]KAJ3269901.1 hypothetical protein HDV01_000828 [Terramyces sp. JEL0728]
MSDNMGNKLNACEYKTGRTLGQGSYATVKEAIKTGEHYAAKVISKKLMKGKEQMILNEINVLRKITKGHKNIISLYDLYLVLDLCIGGELFERLTDAGQFYEKDAAKIVRTVADALMYLHENNIVHRDIKPENLLFKNREPESELVVADFGLAVMLEYPDKKCSVKTSCGTPGYMAPEMILKLGHGKPVDLWAVAKGFIQELLVVDEAKRLTAEQAFRHHWLSDDAVKHHGSEDLLPRVRKGFDARKMFRKAIDVVKAVNMLSMHSIFSAKSSADNVANSPSSRSATTQDNFEAPTENSFLLVPGFISRESSFRVHDDIPISNPTAVALSISTDDRFAMKVISKSLMRGKESLVINEINILKKISQGHKHIVTLIDLMDLCTGGELFDKICEQGIYYEEDAAEIVNTVLEVIKYLHSHNIVHRDIKPENLLFRNKETNADLMVADFGLSRIVNDDEDYMLRTTCGTPSYMAPAKDFISKCLLVDTSKRLSVQQALDHPWFNATKPKQDLFPAVRKGFDARRMFRKAIGVVKAVNKLSNTALNKIGEHGSNFSLLGSESDLRKDI